MVSDFGDDRRSTAEEIRISDPQNPYARRDARERKELIDMVCCRAYTAFLKCHFVVLRYEHVNQLASSGWTDDDEKILPLLNEQQKRMILTALTDVRTFVIAKSEEMQKSIQVLNFSREASRVTVGGLEDQHSDDDDDDANSS
ncbi:hypothetical protein FOL47_005626 [Perkinsus chesapeaki]|uniref:Uncharacterized protein n=1 Tax=Perkinsus chesapeaki TaxID=330153 RepID=A0A7J6MYJ2_PERCH|nr:hypothetical protein FOL47_005626 [Perkinsus chesapeaki]